MNDSMIHLSRTFKECLRLVYETTPLTPVATRFSFWKYIALVSFFLIRKGAYCITPVSIRQTGC